MGLAEDGGTTIGSATTGGTTTRILIFKSELREDVCLSLAKGTIILKRPIDASTTGSQPLKRKLLPYKVRYLIIHNGRQLWDTRWPVFNNSKTKIGRLYSNTSTFGHPIEHHVNNQLGGRASPMYTTKYHFSLIIFTILSSLYISKKDA